MSYVATVRRTISAAHHNGPDGNKCQRNHGHDWEIMVAFKYNRTQLDEYGWGPDFGKIKAVLDRFDHQDLNEMKEFAGAPASSENFAAVLVVELEAALEHFPVDWISVDEGNGNNVTWYRDDDA